MDTPGTPYEEAVRRAESLAPADQLRLAADLIRRLGDQLAGSATRSILELRGLGKEARLDTSVREYVDRERSSWNG
jgi:hypothetical protein